MNSILMNIYLFILFNCLHNLVIIVKKNICMYDNYFNEDFRFNLSVYKLTLFTAYL
jgi:hypothetical protein